MMPYYFIQTFRLLTVMVLWFAGPKAQISIDLKSRYFYQS
jgi:hypothetical protein